MNVSHCAGEDKVPTPFPLVPDVQVTTDSHSLVPDITMTTDDEFSVGTFTSSPVAYPESVTTEGEVRGEFVTHEPWFTTIVPHISLSPTVMETVTDDVVVVVEAQPDLSIEKPKDNVSMGE